MRLIWHETSIDNALGIVNSGIIYGKDPGILSANFHLNPISTSQTSAKGVSLVFCWDGEEQRVADGINDQLSNILYHVSTGPDSDNGFDDQRYWVSRIFPGTSIKLKLYGLGFISIEEFEKNEEKILLLNKKISQCPEISVGLEQDIQKNSQLKTRPQPAVLKAEKSVLKSRLMRWLGLPRG